MTRFGAYDVATAKRVLSTVNNIQAGRDDGIRYTPQQGKLFRTPAGGIPAGGVADCTELWFDSNNDLTEVPDADGNATLRPVKNVFSGDIQGNTTIIVLRLYNRLCAIAEDCTS